MGITNFSNNTGNNNGNNNGSGFAGFPVGGNANAPFDPESYMTNLNKKKHTPTLFRDKIINQMMSVLIGATKPNAILVGPAGTGKTKIVEELAYLIHTKSPIVPDLLQGYTIWNLQLSNLTANASLAGELEDRIQTLVDFLNDPKNKAIVFIDEIHLLYSSDKMYEKIAQILKPSLSRETMHLIGATTTQEMKDIETDPAFNRRFSKILVDELNKEQTVEILKSMVPVFAKHYGTTFPFNDEMGYLITEIADEFCSAGSHRPDNALTLFDRSIGNSIMNKHIMMNDPDPQTAAMAKAMTGIILSENTIKNTAIKITTGNNEAKKFDEEEMRENFSVIQGQDAIIEQLIKIIKLHDMHVRPRKQPLTFLFAGSSGVGKTEIAKILAKSYFGDKPIILNMAEYTSSIAINRIIGAPAGYVGYNDNNEKPFDILDTNPYKVILLDEFEKCNREVQRLFMSIFDEGILQTNRGKTIDFSKTIIIATTNAGCTIKGQKLGFLTDQSTEKTISELSDYFDVELLNRFNFRLTLNDISKDIFQSIMVKTYEKEVKMIKERRPRINLDDTLDEQVLHDMVESHFDPKLGARPINTLITNYIDELLLK